MSGGEEGTAKNNDQKGTTNHRLGFVGKRAGGKKGSGKNGGGMWGVLNKEGRKQRVVLP